MKKTMSIAIDGPAGAGKTTQAKALAKALGFVYVDTGALYRTIALYMIQTGKTEADIDEILATIDMRPEYGRKDGQRMYLGMRDVTHLLRTPEVTKLASDISAIPRVREFLLEMQRSIARNNNVVMEGRDIGTVILPGATLKVFLTADLDTRAWRRSRQMEPGSYLLPQLKEQIRQRDEDNSKRDIAPLMQAEDAILVDNSRQTPQETTAMILSLWEQMQSA